uniref:Uncharacterized protein n=1 Tax=Cacopsylla melanoneura TaxID=428564 RepID=A0A8D8W7Q8_9HEMI
MYYQRLLLLQLLRLPTLLLLLLFSSILSQFVSNVISKSSHTHTRMSTLSVSLHAGSICSLPSPFTFSSVQIRSACPIASYSIMTYSMLRFIDVLNKKFSLTTRLFNSLATS